MTKGYMQLQSKVSSGLPVHMYEYPLPHFLILSNKHAQLIQSLESENKSTFQRKLMALKAKFTKQYLTGFSLYFQKLLGLNEERRSKLTIA